MWRFRRTIKIRPLINIINLQQFISIIMQTRALKIRRITRRISLQFLAKLVVSRRYGTLGTFTPCVILLGLLRSRVCESHREKKAFPVPEPSQIDPNSVSKRFQVSLPFLSKFSRKRETRKFQRQWQR